MTEKLSLGPWTVSVSRAEGDRLAVEIRHEGERHASLALEEPRDDQSAAARRVRGRHERFDMDF